MSGTLKYICEEDGARVAHSDINTLTMVTQKFFLLYFNVGCKFSAERVSGTWRRPGKIDFAFHCDLTGSGKLLA